MNPLAKEKKKGVFECLTAAVTFEMGTFRFSGKAGKRMPTNPDFLPVFSETRQFPRIIISSTWPTFGNYSISSVACCLAE